jgi:hypothetical protein
METAQFRKRFVFKKHKRMGKVQKHDSFNFKTKIDTCGQNPRSFLTDITPIPC